MKNHKRLILYFIFLFSSAFLFSQENNEASKFKYVILRTVTFQGSQKGLVISEDFKSIETTIYISQNDVHILNSYFTFRLKVLKRNIDDNLIMLSCVDVATNKKLDFSMNIPKRGDKKTMSFLLDDEGDGFCFEAFFK